MNKVSKNVFAVLLIISAITVFFGISGVPLLDPDEPVYAETAREMLQFHDFLSPRIFNDFWYDKPPLYYWLVAASFKVFGVSEFAARFPAGLMAVLTVMVVYVSATRIFNERVGFWSGMVLNSSIMFFYMGKAAVTDTTLLFFMTSAMLCFMQEKYWLMYICCGFAVLTKGPIGILLPGAVVFIYILLSGDLYRMAKMHVILGILLSLGIAAPWYFMMYQVHGMEFINTFLGFHNWVRFTTPEHPQRVLWWYYIPVLLLGIFPWTGVLIQSIKDSICESRTLDLRKLIFFQVWWLFVFIFFTVCKTKLVSYILPLFPAVAILIGWNLDRLYSEGGDCKVTGSRVWGSALCFVIMGIGWIIGGMQYPALMFGASVLGALTILLGAGLLMALLFYKDGMMGAWIQAATGVITMVLVFAFMLPLIADNFSVKSLTQAYPRVTTEKDRHIYVDKFLRPGFMFYAEKPGIEFNTNDKECVAEFLADPENKYVVFRKSVYNQYKEALKTENWQFLWEKDGICLYATPIQALKPVVAEPVVAEEPDEEKFDEGTVDEEAATEKPVNGNFVDEQSATENVAKESAQKKIDAKKSETKNFNKSKLNKSESDKSDVKKIEEQSALKKLQEQKAAEKAAQKKSEVKKAVQKESDTKKVSTKNDKKAETLSSTGSVESTEKKAVQKKSDIKKASTKNDKKVETLSSTGSVESAEKKAVQKKSDARKIEVNKAEVNKIEAK